MLRKLKSSTATIHEDLVVFRISDEEMTGGHRNVDTTMEDKKETTFTKRRITSRDGRNISKKS